MKNEMRYLLGCSTLLLVLFTTLSCSSRGGGEVLRSKEEMRMEQCNAMDSTTLRSVLQLDSIKGYEKLSKISADAWILIEEPTGLVISQKNAHKRMYPASLTKMMTCILALENGRMDEVIDISEDVALVRDGRVKLGESYLAGDLLREMMVQSDNDAAYAMAKHVSGDTLRFCRMMNDRAAFLRMDSTRFANPNGMPNDSNYSSARDLLVLARYCMLDTTFAQIVGSKAMKIPLTDGRHLDIQNTNTLLTNYKGCNGIKTGYTRQAGGCLAITATRDDITLTLILLKSRSRWTRFIEATDLLDYGFNVMKAYRDEEGER